MLTLVQRQMKTVLSDLLGISVTNVILNKVSLSCCLQMDSVVHSLTHRCELKTTTVEHGKGQVQLMIKCSNRCSADGARHSGVGLITFRSAVSQMTSFDKGKNVSFKMRLVKIL